MWFDEPFERNIGGGWFWLPQDRQLLDKPFEIYVHNAGSPLRNVRYDPITVYLPHFVIYDTGRKLDALFGGLRTLLDYRKFFRCSEDHGIAMLHTHAIYRASMCVE